MKYRKKPIVIEARKVPAEPTIDDQNARARYISERDSITDWCDGYALRDEGESAHIVISTLEGDMRANPGDWIIKGVNGEFYPCKPDIFEKSYEPVEDE